jgi:lipopolysaccharide/colanic/teichoic acid biosynthesis glycosyltransferase
MLAIAALAARRADAASAATGAEFAEAFMVARCFLCRLMRVLGSKLAALAVLLLTLPLLLTFAAAIQWASPGPVLLRQQRVGREGAVFAMWKLRTMVPDAPQRLTMLLASDVRARQEWDAYGRLENDPRIAGRAARWARQLSVDELPQLLNVLTGEMALVGPRPILPAQTDALPDALRRLRASVRPGMTGLWQVHGRSRMTLRQMARFDRLYVARRCLALDVCILARTLGAVLSRRGAY